MKTSRPNSVNAPVRMGSVLMTVALFLTLVSGMIAAPLYNNVLVSDVGFGNNIGQASSSRNLTVGLDGSIYVVFSGSSGIRVAKSTDNGMTFNPSVFVASGNFEAEIATSENGFIYVTWRNYLNTFYSYSPDGGMSFSTPTPIGTASRSRVAHVVTYMHYVYLLAENTNTLYISHDFGIGPFIPVPIDPLLTFVDLQVDPFTGFIYAISEYPNYSLYISRDFGFTFEKIIISPAFNVNFSANAIHSGAKGNYMLAFGYGASAFRINLNDGSNVPLFAGNNFRYSKGRTIACDNLGNVVDGYNDNGILKFKAGMNLGDSWKPETIIGFGLSHNVAIHPFNNNILVAWSNNGKVYLNVYANEFSVPLEVITNAVSNLTCCSALINGNVLTSNPENIILRGIAYSNYSNPTIVDNVANADPGIGSFDVILGGLCPKSQYFARAYAMTSNGEVYYGNEVSFITPEPVITLSVYPNILTPPNKFYRKIQAYVNVSNAECLGPAVLVSITSSEPESGAFLNDFPMDIVDASYGTADYLFALRAESNPSGPGRTYSIVYKVTDNCGQDYFAGATVFVPILKTKGSLEESENIVDVYPNPSNDYLNVNYNSTYAADAKIVITDLLGNSLINYNFENIEKLQKVIDMKPLASGTYIVYIVFGEERYAKRIIKL